MPWFSLSVGTLYGMLFVTKGFIPCSVGYGFIFLLTWHFLLILCAVFFCFSLWSGCVFGCIFFLLWEQKPILLLHTHLILSEITVPQIHIRCRHFPKDYTADKSLHFSTWFITEYIVCLHMQKQITSDLYFHNDCCSDSFTPWYIGVRANHLCKRGETSKNEWQYEMAQKGKEGKKTLDKLKCFQWPEKSCSNGVFVFLLVFGFSFHG